MATTPAAFVAQQGGAQSIEDGFTVDRYPDGSGAVSQTAGSTTGRWSIDCGIDAMTDKRDCNFHGGLGGLFVHYGNAASPQSVCVLGHDFPGRTAQIRVDANPPLTTDREGCVASSRILAQLKSGSSVATRYYSWPYDYPVDKTSTLAGLNKTIEVVAAIRAGN